MGAGSYLTDQTSDDSSDVEVRKIGAFMQMTYNGATFYANRERFSASSSTAFFNDGRKADQIATESTLSPLSVHTVEMVQAARMAYLMEEEFSINLFG